MVEPGVRVLTISEKMIAKIRADKVLTDEMKARCIAALNKWARGELEALVQQSRERSYR